MPEISLPEAAELTKRLRDTDLEPHLIEKLTPSITSLAGKTIPHLVLLTKLHHLIATYVTHTGLPSVMTQDVINMAIPKLIEALPNNAHDVELLQAQWREILTRAGITE